MIDPLDVRAWLAPSERDLSPFRSAPFTRVAEHQLRLAPFLELLFDAGWTRIGWPVECGGIGGDTAGRSIVYDEVSAAGLDLPMSVGIVEILGPALVRYAPVLARRYLTDLVRGRLVASQGFSEPDAGSDLASVRTRAVSDGDGYRLNGQKVWTSLGHISEWCMVLARTGSADSRHRGLTMFWVDMSAPGVTVRPIECAGGRDDLAEVFLDDVLVPGDCRLGEEGQGWEIAMYLLQFERGTYAWQRQGHLAERFGAALQVSTGGDRDGVADMVGDAWLDVVALRARSRTTVLSLAAGEALGPSTSVDKVLLATAERSTFQAIRAVLWPQLELAEGEGGWLADWYYSRLASVYGGAVEIQRDLIADHVLGLPMGQS